jgi:hypothetical protein
MFRTIRLKILGEDTGATARESCGTTRDRGEARHSVYVCKMNVQVGIESRGKWVQPRWL